VDKEDGFSSNALPIKPPRRIGRSAGSAAAPGGYQRAARAPVGEIVPAGPVGYDCPVSTTETFRLNWETIDAADLGRYPTLVDDLLVRKRDGVTISGVFSEAELARALPRLDELAPAGNDALIGRVLGACIGETGDNSVDRTRYFDDTDRCRPLYRDAFGVDPHERIASTLAPAAGGLSMVPAQEGDRSYNAGQVRWFNPGNGGLRAHVGNEFGELFRNGAMSHLVETARVPDHLSYFVVLDKPEVGGSLSVFDLLWSADDEVPSWEYGLREDSWIDRYPSIAVDAEPGEMVLFGGGWRWHRIEPVQGSKPRITYGGFCAPTKVGRELVFWT
jgi:hypothetical protein